MSWASRRQTTRVEDAAYCLMGIFGVNITLLYGEAEKAFLRLQLEIIQLSDDQTIFAWAGERLHAEAGLLAHCPAEFIKCGNIRQSFNNRLVSPYAMTNKGLRIELPLISVTDQYTIQKRSAIIANPGTQERREYSALRIDDPFIRGRSNPGVYLAVLHCQFVSEKGSLPIFRSPAIFLKQIEASGAPNRYVRIHPHLIESIEPRQFVTMKSEVTVKEPDHNYSHDGESWWISPCYVKKIAMAGSGFTLVDAYPQWWWTGKGEGMQQSLQGSDVGRGALVFRNNAGEGFLVVLDVAYIDSEVAYTDVVTFTSTDIDWENGANAIDELVHMPHSLLDRAHASLPGGFEVFVSLRPGRVSGKRKTIVEITVKQETPPNHTQP
ncbi:hypothetical protein MMC32_005493 [Xylographa parallela]|nr:hypothetical protein [Xylographa parallela]